jgi:hypothetical protein
MSGRAGLRLAVLYPADLRGENAGLFWLHVTSLVELLEPLGWSVDARSTADPGFAEAALAADVAVIQMLADAEVESVILRRRDLGRPSVYEIVDNVLGIGAWLPPSATTKSPLMRQGIVYHAHIADALQMLVPALSELFAGVNLRRVVLSSPTPYPPEMPQKPPGFVFGWFGSQSHAESLRAAAPAVLELCRRHPSATFAFKGNRELFDELFGELPPAQRRFEPFGPRDELSRFVAGLNVGLGPMADTTFNATRSDTRVGMLAGHGAAAVLEEAPPHRGHREHARIYRSTAELLDVLDELFHDRAQVDALARVGREWIERERSPAALGAERDRFYRALIAERDPVVPAPPPRPRANAAAAAARLLEARQAEPEQALEICSELVAAHGDYDQAHLIAARTLERLGRHAEALAYAQAARPSPVYADQFAELKARVDPERRERYRAEIRSPFRRARLAATGTPAERSRAVLEHNPYDHFALGSTIRRLEREDPESSELAGLYGRASLVAPEQVPASRRPAQLAPFLPA